MNTEPVGLTGIDALILCGGLGTRLRSLIADRPKGLAEVAGKPVLDILVAELLGQGCRRIIFCVGHLKEQIIAHYRGRNEAEFLFAEEALPLGTGGALRNALPLVRSDPFLVLNGDSLCQVDLEQFLAFHLDRQATASLVLAEPGARHDGGIVRVDAEMRISAFVEKPNGLIPTGSYISAGIYLFQRQGVAAGPERQRYSLETDVFPALVAQGRCYGFPVAGSVVDIGTPERYRQANPS
ncbi:MAG: sugar phosphate nucleotidyltransferase [Sterolibacterium sp.]|jgi:NDP-sugar pyrophosphorylase family protein